ncbi:hypothetical protein ACJW31_09G057700 [Castanea mollissima]
MVFFFFTLLSSTVSIAKITPRFPSSIVRPEQLSAALSTKNQLYKTNYQTFQQRYLINDTFWGGAHNNAPIFVYTGNEGDIEGIAQNTGFMFEKAPHFKALLVFIEHRFYGKSIPFGGHKDVAYSNASTLGYLSSTQVLADYATVITDLKKNLSATDSPVVVFGGSYGGTAWFRLKYPHITIGALASSSPIFNFENITSSYSFNNIVTKDFRSENQIENKASQPGGLEGWLITAYFYMTMTDYPTPANFLTPLPTYPVKSMCKAIDNPTTENDTFAKLYSAANIYYNYSGAATISIILMIDSCSGACTEMIMPMGGNNKESIFPESHWNYDNRVTFCKLNYGIIPRPDWITTEFGGHDIKRVLKRFWSNIIFFNGLRDPWSGGGVLKNISKSIVAIVAKKGAHHVDLRFSTKEDPEWLKDVRKQEVNIIAKWTAQYYDDLAHLSS